MNRLYIPYIWIVISVTLFTSCNNSKNDSLASDSLLLKFWYAEDTKFFEDYVYREMAADNLDYNKSREVKFHFKIINSNNHTMYFPFQTNRDSTSVSRIETTFHTTKENIIPEHYLEYFGQQLIESNDSVELQINILFNKEWENEDCNIETCIFKLLEMLTITYHPDTADEFFNHAYPIPEIEIQKHYDRKYFHNIRPSWADYESKYFPKAENPIDSRHEATYGECQCTDECRH